jgi:hypothetical protein
MNEARTDFSPTHHALLFAWLSREVIQRVGQEAVRRYGQQRGRRMALRAQANGHALTMANYMAYGEWQAGEGETEQEIVAKTPHVKAHVHLCPWYQAWEKEDLLPYGRLYCLEVDEALVHGFNPELRLDVNRTLSNDGEPCEFVFHGAKLDLLGSLSLAYKKAVRPGRKTVMPWDYHLGHLYKTVGEVIVEELGQVGEEAVAAALAVFAGHYGDEAALIVAAYQDVDFNQLPAS